MEKLITGAGVKSAWNRLVGGAAADAQKLENDVDKAGKKASKEVIGVWGM